MNNPLTVTLPAFVQPGEKYVLRVTDDGHVLLECMLAGQEFVNLNDPAAVARLLDSADIGVLQAAWSKCFVEGQE